MYADDGRNPRRRWFVILILGCLFLLSACDDEDRTDDLPGLVGLLVLQKGSDPGVCTIFIQGREVAALGPGEEAQVALGQGTWEVTNDCGHPAVSVTIRRGEITNLSFP